MSVSGDVNLAFWVALFRAALTGQVNANGYTYAVASQVDPGDADDLARRPGRAAQPGEYRHPGLAHR